MPSAQMIEDMQNRLQELEERLAAKSVELVMTVQGGTYALKIDLDTGRYRLQQLSTNRTAEG